MFGYILPFQRNLSEDAQRQYRADYCGLCRQLKKSYGFRARFLVSYDITFLYSVLASQENSAEQMRCFCPAHPFCRRDCVACSDNLSYCADITVILAWWKLRDTINDEGFFRRQAAKLLLRIYRKAYRRAEEKLPVFAKHTKDQLEKLAVLEKQKCSSIDRTADTFAELLAGCIPQGQDSCTRIMRQILYHTGRYLYLIDALDDLQKDVKKKAFNPFVYRYMLEDGKLSEADRQEVLETLLCSVHQIRNALQLLTAKSHKEYLENIIDFGLPTAAKGVAAGVFRKKNRRKI